MLAVLEDGALPAGAHRAAHARGAAGPPSCRASATRTTTWRGSARPSPRSTSRCCAPSTRSTTPSPPGPRTLPPDAFVMGAGYDDVVLGGSPHHAALDRAAGGRPVRLQHRSGHVCAGSTEALRRAGILDAAGRRGPVAVPGGREGRARRRRRAHRRRRGGRAAAARGPAAPVRGRRRRRRAGPGLAGLRRAGAHPRHRVRDRGRVHRAHAPRARRVPGGPGAGGRCCSGSSSCPSTRRCTRARRGRASGWTSACAPGSATTTSGSAP